MRNIPLNMRLLFFLLVVFGITACDPSRRTTGSGKRPIPPKKDIPQADNTKMDTVRWTVPSTNIPPPISTSGENESGNGVDMSRTYNVALLLPFLTNKFDQYSNNIPAKSKYALHFYSGAKLAFEQLSIEEPQLKLKVNVIDSYVSDADFYTALENPNLESADLIIGPVRSSHVSLLGKKTKIYNTPIISPFSPSENLLMDYPNYFQMNPSLRMHCETLLEFALGSHGPEQIVLVCRQKESSRLAYFQKIAAESGYTAFPELIVPDNASSDILSDLKPYVNSIWPTAFIVPSWSSEDFVNTFLRELKKQKASNKVTVLGMPQWDDYERIENELLSTNNVHIVSSAFINNERQAVKDFKSKYISEYGTVPIKYAFDGYDIAYWTGKMLTTNGLKIGDALNNSPIVGLRNDFLLSERIDIDGTLKYMENKELFILKFVNGHYLPIGIE